MFDKQTSLDLNGPVLQFTSNPVGVATTGIVVADSGTVSSGVATFSGIATAFFHTVGIITNPATNTGYITYRWNEVGVGALTDSTYVTGTATTTLTLSNLITPTDNRREFFLTADYVPSAYSQPIGSAVTVGTARSTGNAINDGVSSGIATLSVLPLLEIVSQPSNISGLVGTSVTFTIDAGLTDSFFTSGVQYQWFLNGVAVSDGTVTDTTDARTKLVQSSSNGSVTLPSDSEDITVTVAGAKGGGGGSDAGGSGGSGGNGRVGKFTLANGGRTLSWTIGKQGGGGGGCFGSPGDGGSGSGSGGRGGQAGAGGDGRRCSGFGGGGGGGTAVRSDGSRIIVAGGGGGGGGGSWNRGASGGGTAGSFGNSTGEGSGSEGNTPGQDGGGGGGGGGGTSGGGGGSGGADNSSGGTGGGGGGSGYNSSVATLSSQWENGGGGYVNVEFTSAQNVDGTVVQKTRNTTVSGATTPRLTLNTDRVGIQTVQVRITNPDSPNSPIFSDVVNFAPQDSADIYNIRIEPMGVTDTVTSPLTVDLFNGEYEINAPSFKSSANVTINQFSLHAPDRDIDIEMDVYGGKGSNSGSFVGGEGGYSRIRFTMERNTEYIIAGLSTSINAPFIYKKGSLIASVGGGGHAGTSGNGGFGGGVGVAGQDGRGRLFGDGGALFTAGNLPSNGIFGSLTSLTASSPDTKATSPDGGRALPCPRGVYWRNQGVSPCTDVGTSRFRLSDGTLVTNSASISRGFKAGYSIIQTAGAGNNGGNGGNGATGGQGGESGSGGGGGSGYTDGSVTIVDAQLGGSSGDAKVILRVVT